MTVEPPPGLRDPRSSDRYPDDRSADRYPDDPSRSAAPRRVRSSPSYRRGRALPVPAAVRPGGTRAPDRPSGNPIRRGLLRGIRDRPTGIRPRPLLYPPRSSDRKELRSLRCSLRSDGGVARRALPAAGSGVARAVIRSVPASVAPVVPAVSRAVSGVRYRGRRGRRTDRRIHGGRHGTGDGPADPAAAYHRHRGRRPCGLRPAGRRGHGRSWVGRRRGRSSAGPLVPARPSSRVVTAVVPAAVAPVAAGSPIVAPAAARLTTAAIVAAIALTALGPGATPAVLPPTAVVALTERKGEARTIRTGAPIRRPNDRTRPAPPRRSELRSSRLPRLRSEPLPRSSSRRVEPQPLPTLPCAPPRRSDAPRPEAGRSSRSRLPT